MNKLTNTVLHHPGLWMQNPQDMNGDGQVNNIETLKTETQGQAELEQLLPELVQKSYQGRWIVLINPPSIGYKQRLTRAGVRMDRVLVVHGKDEVETLWATEKALTSGTSSVVISWPQTLDAKDRRRLQLVAKSARASGFILENAVKLESVNS